MTHASTEVHRDLLQSLLALEGLPGFELLEGWSWYPRAGKWALKCRLTPLDESAQAMAAPTDWYVLVSETYPWGNIAFMPARDGGARETYPHQLLNKAPKDGLPWRTGEMCTGTPVGSLGRQGYDIEPYEARERLKWRCDRALDWLRAACEGALSSDGDPFELPHFEGCCSASPYVVFGEDSTSLTEWYAMEDRVGDVSFFQPSAAAKYYATDSFHAHGAGAFLRTHWGKRFRTEASDRRTGAWIRLDAVPYVLPWKPPETWGELRRAAKAQGLDIDALLKVVARGLRDGEEHIVLIAFPIPAKVGDPPANIHFIALELPRLSRGGQYKGSRPSERGYWRRDLKKVINDKAEIRYLNTENWHHEQIATRGRLDQALTSSKVAVLGCGALGAPLAELLVRGGVFDLMLVDNDVLEAGNLVRHLLTVGDLDKNKADALAERLNGSSPHAEVSGIPHAFPPADNRHSLSLREATLVIDCTGSDEVLPQVEVFSWDSLQSFVSLSLGFGAKRLFVFQSPSRESLTSCFRDAIAPWLQAERKEYAGEEFPREGIGCYHPVFPARCDDMWLWASVAVKLIEQACLNPPVEPAFYVYEQSRDEMGLPQIRRVDEAA